MKVPGEMKVDVFAGDDPGFSPAGGPALHPEDRPQGRLAQGREGFFPGPREGIDQANGRRRLALSGRRGRHGRDEDKLPRRPAGRPGRRIHLGFVGSELNQIPRIKAQLGRNFNDWFHRNSSASSLLGPKRPSCLPV